jgi:AraC-like DNA-binding protein
MAFVYRYPPGVQPGDLWLELEKPYTLPNDQFMAHRHEYMELTLITHGTGWHRVANQEHLTAPGDVIIVPPGVVHSFFRSKNQTHRNFHFDPAILAELKKDAPDMATLTTLFPELDQKLKKGRRPQYTMARLRLTPRELAKAEQMMSEMDEEQTGKQAGRMALMHLILRRMFMLLARIYTKRESPTPKENSGLAKSLEFLNANALEPLTLQRLAEVAGLSASHYRRLFQRSFGDSPINYLIRLRIRMACALLEKGNLPITEVAFQCGFTDSNYFARQFRKAMGETPRRYRELFSHK